VAKAVHRSGSRDKHNWPQPLTPQSIMSSLNHCDLLRHVGVNNLPKGIELAYIQHKHCVPFFAELYQWLWASYTYCNYGHPM